MRLEHGDGAGRPGGQAPARGGGRGPLSVLVAAENISLRLSGETILPYHYLARFQQQGMEVHGICHARVRDELRIDLPPALFDRLAFVEDHWLQRLVYAIGRRMPYRIEDLVFNQAIHVMTQLRMRRAVRQMVADKAIDVIFEPAPIAPKALSFLYGFGVPVVIGPMSGGMDLPPAFRDMDPAWVRWTIRASRRAADALHRFVPGKLQAAALIVGNAQTSAALPRGTRGQVVTVMESGVAFEEWVPKPDLVLPAVATVPPGVVSFIFCSRFVDWKGIRYLVKAFAPLAREGGVRLDLVGDGDLFNDIAALVRAERVEDSVVLHGRQPFDRYIEMLREADVYVTPSLRECGGMAMLEAMAIGLPIIGVRWGGAAQYAGDSCALLVEPSSEAALVEGLTRAMRTLARSPEMRQRLGKAARKRIIDADLGWESKSRQIAAVLMAAVLGTEVTLPTPEDRAVRAVAAPVSGA